MNIVEAREREAIKEWERGTMKATATDAKPALQVLQGGDPELRAQAIRDSLDSLSERIRLATVQGDYLVADALAQEFRQAHARLMLGPGEEFKTSTLADAYRALGDIEWLWPKWIPKGHITMLAAEKGKGKSSLWLWLSRCVINGEPWPDGHPGTGGGKVLLCEAESGSSMHVKRARDFGIPLDSIINFSDDPLARFNLESQKHLESLEAMIRQHSPSWIVVDAFSSAHCRQENDNRTGELMRPLADLAQRHKQAVFVLHHLRKRQRDPNGKFYEITAQDVRGGSSIQQLARVILALDSPNAEDEQHLRLKWLIGNLGIEPPPIGMRREGDDDTDKGFAVCDAPESKIKLRAQDKAEDFLAGLLAEGKEMNQEAAKAAYRAKGFTDSTMTRARKALGVESKRGAGGAYVWFIRDASPGGLNS